VFGGLRGEEKTDRRIPLSEDSVRNDRMQKFWRDGVERCSTPTRKFAERGPEEFGEDGAERVPLPGWRKIIHARQSGLFEGAVEKFHDVHDVLAGFVDFGAGA